MFPESLKRIAIGAATAMLLLAPSGPARAQTDPLLGQLMAFGGNFCPRGWLPADGRVLPISTYYALFSILGTMYGGDGRTTMALPDLRGRSPVGVGQGPGLTDYLQGQKVGVESVSITVEQMPAHNHQVQATNEVANKAGPGGKFLAVPVDADDQYFNIYWNSEPNRMMHADMITPTGGNEPVDTRSPVLAMQWCVATVGVFPSRN